MKFLTLLVAVLCLAAPVSAQSIHKRAEFKLGDVSEADVTDIMPRSTQFYVVGAINERGNAQLYVFRGTETVALSQIELGRASSIAVANVANPNQGRSGRFVSAMRDSNGELRAILWGISEDGRSLVRLHHITGPKIQTVELETFSTGSALLVARRDNGKMMVRGLRYAPDDTLSLPVGETFGPVKDFALDGGLVGGLAMRIGNDRLKVTSFVEGGDAGFGRMGSREAGTVSSLDIVSLDSGDVGYWATVTSSAPVNTAPWFNHCAAGPFVVPYAPIGRGKLIAWKRDSILDPELQRLGEREFIGRGGLAHEVAAARVANRRDTLVTGHLGYGKRCAFKPRLELHLWDFDEDEGFTKRATKTLGGDYRGLAMADFGSLSGKSRLVTVMRGRGDGRLKIAVWELSTFE